MATNAFAVEERRFPGYYRRNLEILGQVSVLFQD